MTQRSQASVAGGFAMTLSVLAAHCGGQTARLSPSHDAEASQFDVARMAESETADGGSDVADVTDNSDVSEVSCAPSATCTPDADVCGNAPNGTPCAENAVCFSGACVMCSAGSPCNPNGNACQTGTTSCSTGQATCVLTGDVADGTGCSSGICCGGLCAACSSTPPNATAVCSGTTCAFACTSGHTLCGNACADTTNDTRACGPSCMACAPGSTCKNSQCSPCTDGTPCSPGGNMCQTGATSCTTGMPVCNGVGNVPNGTPCGANHVCNNGGCVECTAGTVCSPGGNPCQAGTTSCTTGQSVCSAMGNVADGAACQNGTCCNGQCLDTTRNIDACGPSCRVCPGGSDCMNSMCVIDYGSFMPYYPCGNTVTFLNAHLLAAQPFTVSADITVLSLGVVANQPTSGLRGVLALYSDASGAPSTLKASTASSTIVAGRNEIPVVTTTTVSPGTYWIAGEFQADASICADNSTNNPVSYIMLPSYPVLPNPFGTATRMPSVHFNFYVVGAL
jgi:hypothetical protein